MREKGPPYDGPLLNTLPARTGVPLERLQRSSA